MSLEAFGDESPGIDADDLYRQGWESDPDCKVWWRKGEPEETFTIQEAAEIQDQRDADLMEDDWGYLNDQRTTSRGLSKRGRTRLAQGTEAKRLESVDPH